MKDEIAGCLESLEAEPAPDAEGPQAWSASFRFPAELSIFTGHFPGAPLVPAVYLIEVARLTAERGWAAPVRVLEIVDARFTLPVGPGDRVVVRVELGPEQEERGRAARAVVLRGDAQAARFRLRLGRDPAR